MLAQTFENCCREYSKLAISLRHRAHPHIIALLPQTISNRTSTMPYHKKPYNANHHTTSQHLAPN